MNQIRTWFLYKVYLYDRRLFYFLATFSSVTLLCNIMGDEITPFFIWAMYSEKEKTTGRYEFFKIQVNDSILVDYTSGYTDNNRFFLHSPLSYYQKMQQNNGIDPALSFLQNKLTAKYKSIKPTAERVHNSSYENSLFINWYKNYLQQTTGQPVHSLEITVLTGHFNQQQKFQTDSAYSFAKWKQR